MPDDVVIVGASVSGVRTAEALRRRGFGGRITLIGAEPRMPYDRPPLSKAFLTGRATEDDLPLLAADRLDRLQLELWLGQRAEGVDLPGRRVRLAWGEQLPFGTAVIATGSVPRRLPAVDGWPACTCCAPSTTRSRSAPHWPPARGSPWSAAASLAPRSPPAPGRWDWT